MGNGPESGPVPEGTGRTGWRRVAATLRRRASAVQDALERMLARSGLWAALFVVAMVPLVSEQSCSLPAPAYEPGEVARGTVKARFDVEITDETATRRLRESEMRKVPPVYDLLPGTQAEQRQHIADLFERGRAVLRGAPPAGGRGRSGRPDSEPLTRLRSSLGEPLAEEALSALAAEGFSTDLQADALRVYGTVMQGRIVAHREGLPDQGPISVREIRPGDRPETLLSNLEQIRTVEEARAALRAHVDEHVRSLTAAERRAVVALLERHVISNLSYNASETERRRALAVASVPQVFTRIPRGRVVVREGEVFTPETLAILARIRDADRRSVNWKAIVGHLLVLSLLSLFLHRYVTAHQRVFRRVKNLYSMVLAVALLVTLATRVGAFVAGSVADQFFTAPFNDPSIYYWALPVASGSMLITLLANGRVATVAGAFIAVLFGMALGWDARALLFGLLSSFAAIHGTRRAERRSSILATGLQVGAVNAVVVFAMKCIADGFSPATDGLVEMAAAVAGGLLSAVVVSFALPIVEWIFNVLTDIRLLELSNLDNALLRRLALEAPGTYNHSVIVGTLAERAAEEIGAHALFCRVAAYYHDIGKVAKPEYFVENMRDGVNRHDRLSPRMSSLIIASHVKEGIRLSEEYNLPRQVRDIIPQHHGTRLITFFYRKAKRKEDPDVPEIHESDYRYPGPKPQTKEAAIFMMADSVEAAARSVDDPTPAKFDEVVRTVFNSIVLDHQLDECDLTFSDLARIGSSFLKTLAAVHHHRVSYPGFEFDRARPRAVEAE